MADVSEISISELETIETICRRQRRVLHRVPPIIRAQVKNPWIYDPEMFQFGAYNYLQQKKANQLNINLQAVGDFRDREKKEFSRTKAAEQFKDEVLDITLDSASKEDRELADKDFFIRKFLEHVDEFRHFYGGLSKDYCTDEELADMMLRDACFVLFWMGIFVGDYEGIYRYTTDRLGWFGYNFVSTDILKLENQIPLSAIKLLFNIIHKETTEADDQWKTFLCKVLPRTISVKDIELKRVPWGQEQPLHLLEAIREAVLSLNEQQQQQESSNIGQTKDIYEYLRRLHLSRSVTELKAKGIQVRSSGSSSFKDIKFTSYRFSGILELPVLMVSQESGSMSGLSNLIAFEMSPGDHTDLAITGYVTFMKSLIQSPKDVRELREKGILLGVGDDNQLMKVFEEIITYAIIEIPYIGHIQVRIEDHCNNKWKTWMADLINSKFATPWSAIALFSAIVLLFLTFLQTIYTMKQSI